MKTITVLLSDQAFAAMDVPEGVTVRVVNADDASATTILANGEVATVTEFQPDSEMLKDLPINAKGPADGVPARPDVVYADQWKGWAAFLGWVPREDDPEEG